LFFVILKQGPVGDDIEAVTLQPSVEIAAESGQEEKEAACFPGIEVVPTTTLPENEEPAKDFEWVSRTPDVQTAESNT
jgi:hypothetical protein